VLAGTSPVYNSTGKITGALGMFSNITERKRAEKALLESEERFRTLADNISQLAWMTDYEGNLFWYNERWYEYTGTNFEEMKNRGWQKVHDPEYVDRVTEKFDTHIKKGEPWEDVFPLRGKDGKYRWFLSRALPIKDENGNIVRWFGTNTDITDQKKLEDSLLEALESLKNSEEKYKAKSQELETLLDAIPSVVWISHDPESKLMTGNKASYDFLGIVPGVNVSASTSEILKARIAEQRINGEAVKPEDLPMQKSMRNKKASPNVEIEMVFNDGTSKILYGNAVPVLNKAGDVTGCVSAFIDITEMKKTREALKESEEQLRFALESAGAGSWEWDAKSGREKWSAENYALLGVDRRKSDPLPEDWLNVVLPEDREKFLIASQESIENKTALNFEYRIQHPSKGIRWILGKGKTKYDDNGDPLKMAGIAIDITERKQIEEALRESNERFIMLADSAPVLIWMADKDKNYNYFNKGWLDFTGKGIAEESGKQWTNGIHPEDRENVIKYFSTAFNNRESYVMEYRLRRADGQYRWILDKGIPRYEGNVFVGYIGSCIDITERKIAENHLRIQYSIANALTESKNLKDATYKVLESLCRGLGWELGMWWVVDKHTNLLKVESIWKDDILKDKTNELFDYNAVFKPGEGLPGTVWEEGNSKWVNDIMSDPNFPRKKLASSLGLHAAFAFPTWSGEEVTGIIECFSDKILTSKEDLLELLDAAGRQIGNFVERKTAEAKYQDLYENAPDMHISFDPVSGIITQCNTTLENVSGYRKEELIGKRIYSLFHAGSISQVRKIQAEFNKTGYVKNAELQLKKKDGSKVDVILNASAVRDEDGNIIYSRSSIRDISERKQLELAIQQRDIELTDFLENAPVGVSRIAEDGTILWANDAEIESLGYKRKNYIGHNINEFLLDKNLWGKIVKLLRKDELIENFDLQILSKDGSIKYWLISTNVYSENGRFIYAKTFSRDITLRKIAERDLNVQYSVSSTLAESRTFKNAALKILQAICEGVGWQLGLWWKVEDTSNKLKIQSYWYSSKLKYIDFDFFDPAYGHTKNDGLPGRVWNTQHPYWVTDINKDKKFKRVKTASKMGLKSAFAFPIMIGNKVAAVIECFSDSVISPNVELLNMLDSAGRQIGNFIERINAEEALIEANNTLEERVKERTSQLKNVIEKLEHEIKEREKAEKEIEILAQAIKSTNDSVSITDLSNRILFVNNAFEDTYGYREEEVLGKSINIIRSKKVSKALTSQINESTLKGGWQGELENIKKDGTEFPVWLSTSIVKDDARKPRAFIGVSVDITESKKNQLLIEKQSGLVKLLQEITVAANETFDIKEALKITVNKICRHIGWEVGHVYLLNKNNVLESSRIWHLENPKKFSSFKNLTEKTLMTTGFGIPGKVMEIKQSLWIEDINASNIFARSRLKGKNVLKSALAFPILVNNEIAGVMEFFTARNIEEDKQIMNITENIGSQLGRVIERSRALDTIKDSETRFRAVAETANEAIVTTDSDFNILYFNRSAENIFQYRENEIKGKNFLDLFSVNEHDELKKTYRQIRKSDKNITGRTIEFAGVRKDSSEFPLDLSLASWKSTDGVYYTAMIRDISKRKKAEMELRKRESQLRYAQHIAHMGSFEWDIQNNHVTWSDELYKIYGVGMNEFDGTFEAFIKYIHPEDKENIRQQVENMLAKGSAFSLEERIIRPSGEIRILQTRGEFLKDENGNIVKLLGACQDITERKKAEEQLLLSEKQLRDAQKIAHLGSWEWNIQLNKLTFSEEFYRIYGIEPFSIPPEKINTISFIHPEDKPWAENLGKSLLLEQKPFGVFYRIILPDGKIKFIKAEGEVDTDSDGKVKRMFGSIQDVTEQKEIEEELRFANEKLRLAQNELIHSEKLAALGRFSSGIAHEIRNPLANISALAQILMSKYKVDQKMKKHLRYILINTDIANRIIKDLLNFASPDDVVYRAGSLEKIINNLYNIVKSRCVRNKVHLIKKISPNLPAIQLNEKKLQAAFLNFISNAIDAMPKGGKLRIDAELDKKNKEVIISFEDTGIGISQEYMDKIFEPFFTTKDDGTGLGLSLAYQVIKSHAGKLEIQSKIGHGTKIEVKLPARIE
jgi:PAS domain S-box-containing protein